MPVCACRSALAHAAAAVSLGDSAPEQLLRRAQQPRRVLEDVQHGDPVVALGDPVVALGDPVVALGDPVGVLVDPTSQVCDLCPQPYDGLEQAAPLGVQRVTHHAHSVAHAP